ncbi:hypothetical protein A5765_01175 [Mycolicibacterium celeriflavum]|uniref:hypothetical protein n=1 Tax=Mycolicibacterium celeriflavum TaxID=1249101 RepID=UPI000801F060|nr:hypothetical protein [Mycolicibacterium celeriflavum]OBG23370.1 hypothetical protein A5765_01175 [Mycolicibacterium celeriflavum]
MGEPIAAHPALRGILDQLATESGAVPLRASLAGLALRPVRYGGLGKQPGELISEIYELSAFDGSLGWLAAMFNAAADEVARLPEPAADVVWRCAPDALIVSGYRGEGVLSTDRRLTGHWESVIGARYADWLLLSADNGAACRVLLPRSAARIEPGDHSDLRAAGVSDVTVSGVTVDETHVFIADSASVIAEAGAAAAVVGSADGAWRQHVEQVRARLSTSHGGDEVSDASCAQVAWAASDIDAAKLQITASLQLSDTAARRRAHQQAVARARGAADRVLASSRHALDAADPVTRLWRDVQAGGRLAVRLFERRHPADDSTEYPNFS